MQNLAAATDAAHNLLLKINQLIVNPLVVLLFTFSLVVFLWGVRGYITHSDNPEMRAQGANQILWGVIGMALMFLSFTIVRIVINTVGVDSETKGEVDKVLGGR